MAQSPVRARLAAKVEDWRWSKVRVHLAGQDGDLVVRGPVLDRVERFADLITGAEAYATFAAIRAAELSGWPLGASDFNQSSLLYVESEERCSCPRIP